MRDDLATWCRGRAVVPWAEVVPPLTGPLIGDRDGVVQFVDTQHRARDPRRADRLLAALAMARAEAGDGLDFARVARWQAAVLGPDADVGFRRLPAFAKGGRDRYGLDATTPQRFDDCLRQAADQRVPLCARAARAYLDVSFFHPFADGNGRAALLALYAVLAGEQVVLDRAAPLAVVVRRADDVAGAGAFARLVHRLALGTRRRAAGAAEHAAGAA